jgi:hypothetical protein
VVGESVTAIAGGAVTVIAAEADFVVSATEIAVRVTFPEAGTVAGAVYMTAAPDALLAADSVPQVGPLHPVPESDQVTPLFAGSFCTVALKLCVPDAATLAEVEESETETGALGADNVIAVEADFVASARDVAVTVTAAGVGTAPGAV